MCVPDANAEIRWFVRWNLEAFGGLTRGRGGGSPPLHPAPPPRHRPPSATVAPRSIVVDPLSPLSHKAAVGQPDDTATPVGVPSWCPPGERRRLAGYTTRAAYIGNVARLLLPTDVPDDERDAHTEYGDAALLRDRIVAAVLGDDWTVTVDGADDDLGDTPDLPDPPEEPGDDADDLTRRVYAAAKARWQARAEAEADRWVEAVTAQPALQQRQDDLHAWVDAEGVRAHVHEVEQDTAGLGDGVTVLWHQTGGWPRVQIMDPACFFPVEDDADDGRFPRKVHFAWEYTAETPDGRGGFTAEQRVRRLTFELVEVVTLRTVADRRGQVSWADADGQPADAPTLPALERVLPDGRVTRLLPWQVDEDGRVLDGEQPSTLTCLLSDGTWPLDGLGSDARALDESKATWSAYREDLGIDFLPVVHQTNTPTGKHRWGAGVFDTVAQVLDDVAGADTAAASASRYIRDPTVFAPGVEATDTMMPGRLIGGPENGKMTVLDLSRGLEKLLAYGGSLAERLWVNAGVPAEILGRADAAEVSGVALALRLAPFAQLVGAMRMVREPKWALVWRMAQRMAQVQQALPMGPTPTARIRFGSFLPTDRKATAETVATLLGAGAMSPLTAVQTLVGAGFPVSDASTEVERIRAADTAGAKAIADATASEQLAAEWLGLTLPDRQGADTVGVVTLPPDGGGAAG